MEGRKNFKEPYPDIKKVLNMKLVKHYAKLQTKQKVYWVHDYESIERPFGKTWNCHQTLPQHQTKH